MTRMTLDQAMQRAVEHHQAGRLHEAELIYRQILARNPNQPNLLSILGFIALQQNHFDAAIDLIRRALAIDPKIPEAHNNLASALKNTGRLDEAVAAYRQAAEIHPDSSEAFLNLANALTDQGQPGDAIAAYRRAIALNPSDAIAHCNLGLVLAGRDQFDDAIAEYRRSIELMPGLPDAHNNLGIALKNKGQLAAAVAAYQHAIALRPNYPQAYSNLGNVLQELGRAVDSAEACRQAIQLKPDFPQAHNNLGFALQDQGKLDQAIASFQRAIQLQPNYPEAQKNLGIALLLSGNFKQGWTQFESRWRCREFIPYLRNFPQPQWTGQDLKGRALFLYMEQGFGDNIQFIRYIPLLAKRGARVILQTPPQLQRLLAAMPGIDQLLSPDQIIPPFDFHCPLLSLPLAFETDLATIPREVPYLSPPIDTIENWQKKLGPSNGSLRVGIAWAGFPGHVNDRNRSIPLAQFSPLANIPRVTFHSLQKDKRLAENSTIPLIDHTQAINDFTDTTALVANLDLVISVDTSIVHLAGAIAKPVWTMLPFAPDWRWLLHTDDSPWYPTMRLFRQTTPGNWSDVIHRVAQSLADLAAKH